MEYNNFIKEVVAELKKFYGEGYEVEVTEQMIRCDTSYDGLVIKDKKGEESPVFHLTDCYSAFCMVPPHLVFNQIKIRYTINYSDREYIRLIYAAPFVLS